jgi:PAS domain S-box-containing protein
VAERNRQRLEALNEVSRHLASVHESEEVLSLIVNEACRLLGAQAAGVRILDGAELVAAARTESAEALMARERIRVGESLSGHVVEHGEVLIIEDLVHDPRHDPAHKAAAVALGFASFIGAPLRAGGRTIGAINVFTKARRRFDHDEIGLLSAFADQAALAIDKARLYRRQQEQLAEVETLAAVGEALASSLDLDVVLERVLDGALRIVGAERAAVFTLDATGELLRARAARGGGAQPGFAIRVGHAVVGDAVARRVPVGYADVRTASLPGAEEFYAEHGTTLAEAIRRQQYRGILAAPLVVGEGVLGAISVYWSEAHEATAREIRLLTAVARQAAVALDSARLYEEAQTQRTRLAQIFESTSDGIVLVGRDGAVQAVNHRAGELLDFDANRAVGAAFDRLITRDARAFAGLRAALAEPQRRSEGDLDLKAVGRVVHWVAQPTLDAGQATIGFTLTLQDVTQERLASQMKTDFVSFVTHQLRTPLSGIKWMLELASEAPDRVAEMTGYVRDAREAAERLIDLVNDLLDASRLESGRLSLSLEEVDLRRLTCDVLDEIAPLLRDKRHRPSVEASGSAMARADAQLLRQVVLNLVSNAVKYTPPGGAIAVRVGTTPDRVEWAITDSGIGIPKEAQRRLFEKFFRADNVFAVETEGTGLGLYLVRLIVEKHGGRVWCESEEGRGSTFAFALPVTASTGGEGDR